MLTRDQFELAYRRAMDKGGHSYDDWDIEVAWCSYQKMPDRWEWIPEAYAETL